MKKILTASLIVLVGIFMFSAPRALAQVETGDCFGNFDCDQDVDADDVTEFLKHFGRDHYYFPCPLCQDSPCPCTTNLPQTGQTSAWATGDDGDLEKGLAWQNPRFTDNEDGTITDNLTNLVWLKKANCFGTRTWINAIYDCNGLADGEDCGTGGSFLLSDGSSAGDWRLPNRRELLSLIHDGYHNPPVPNTVGTGQWSEEDPFINVLAAHYWSSTSHAFYSNNAWVVSMFNGGVYTENKTIYNHVLPVRDPL